MRQLAAERALCAGVTLVAYSVSRIMTEKTDKHSDRLLFYGEPTPESIGPLRGFLDGGGTFQKMILMTTEEHLQEVRPLAVVALQDNATLTTALPGMLEVGFSPELAAGVENGHCLEFYHQGGFSSAALWRGFTSVV